MCGCREFYIAEFDITESAIAEYTIAEFGSTEFAIAEFSTKDTAITRERQIRSFGFVSRFRFGRVHRCENEWIS